MNARRENQIAWMLVLGVAIVLVGILITILSFGSAVSLKSKTPAFMMFLGPIWLGCLFWPLHQPEGQHRRCALAD
jgi:prepilin signal peptidase PulO-like enzyme (type II secretory pathway)